MKEIVLQPDVELATVPENVVRALISVGEANQQEYETQLKGSLPKYAASADDDKLWRVLLIVGNDSRVWAWLDEPTRIRIRNLITGNVKPDQITYLALAFKVPELASILRERFDLLDDDEKEKFIGAVCACPLA